ncbi:DUF4365 domain-containing protein [Candidatus Bathyarchaeota archaeon]|nr:DUF4365 domain-containing protein [Candidatus Bathyarchaeota archaeon]
MQSKPKVPWNTRLGRIGESEIEGRLDYFSNPVKYELDVGIDYYCELIEKDSPSRPFYVQAKGTEHFDDYWGQNIKKTTIMYWLEQQHPVFLIAYDENDGLCYRMSIEDKRYELLSKMGTPSDTIYSTIDKSHILEKGRDTNYDFIKKIKEDSLSIELWKEHPQPSGESYVKTIPPRPRSQRELILAQENLRMNMYSLIQHYLAINDLQNASLCCEFLSKFDRSHYNHFVWLARVSRLLGDEEKARTEYEEALRICERDKKWPTESMDKLKDSIRKEMET